MTIDGDNGRMTKRSKALWALVTMLALNAVLLAAQPGLAVPRALGSYFFGPNLVRAEVLLSERGVLHDYRIDRGVIRAKEAGSLTLRERDGTLVTIAISPTASITLRGRPVPFSLLRRAMVATVIRDGDAPATEVRVTRK